jgi:zinc finger protein
MEKIDGETCPVCFDKTLTLMEDSQNIPHFGEVYILSMSCDKCGFRKADIDTENAGDPVKIEFEVDSIDDMSVRVVRGSEATITFPEFKTDISPGEMESGYVANVEKVLNDLLKIVEMKKESEESKPKKKKLRQMVDDILDAKEGKKKITIVMEDPTGVSAIISEKSKKSALKVKKKKKK